VQKKHIISESGGKDLLDIYIYNSKYSENYARKTINKIFEYIYLLREYPNLGRKLKNRYETNSEKMFIYCLKYIILYSYTDSTIIIERIISTRTNFIKHLF
jgi:Plasmid stabilization system protein